MNEMQGYGVIGARSQDYGQPQISAQYAGDQIKRQAEIPRQLGALEDALTSCMKGIEVLGSRLEGAVMRGQPPSAEKDAAATPVLSTPYGSRLQEITRQTLMLGERIHSLLDRLEV